MIEYLKTILDSEQIELIDVEPAFHLSLQQMEED